MKCMSYALLLFFLFENAHCGSVAFSSKIHRRFIRSFDCHPGYFVCNSSKICVEQRFICDDFKDCEDGSDEWNCTDKNKDEYYNSLFQKRPDEDRDKMKFKTCKLTRSPPPCQCSWKSLFCENRGLKSLPQPLPTDVKELDLSGNDLHDMGYANFTNLSYLQILILNNAGLSTLGEMVFHKLGKMQYLYMNGNRLRIIKNGTFLGNSALRFLYLSFNPIQKLENGAFVGLENLEGLFLRHCSLSSVTSVTFKALRKLRSLWLDENNLITLPDGVFQYLTQLETLSLSRNNLINVDGKTLLGLWKLKTLYLTSNSLTFLKDQNFGNLSSLLTLDLQDNEIYTVEVKAFVLLEKLNSLNLKDNALRHIQSECFSSLTSLQYIYFSNFYFCSYARHVRVREPNSDGISSFSHLLDSITVSKYFSNFYFCSYARHVRVCEPNSDGISSFSHLLDSIVLRISVWIVAGLACIGNISVVISRSLLTDTNRIHSFYIKNLSIADFLMCLYLFVIAGHDVAFRGEYIRHDVSWRHSWQCTFAGMLSTLSSEASIFIMTIITADRYLSIVYPLMLRRRTMVFAGTLVTGSWVAAATIAIVPIFNLGYFGDEYYGNNGVCLPLQIHDPFSKGWQYSMAVFCGLNSAAFGFICYAYVAMFLTISRSKLGLRSSQQLQDRTIAKRFSFIVATDLLCWLPIIVIKTLAISGVTIYSELYAWVAVFMLPINSALNPILYTLTTRLFKQQLARIVYTWKAGGVQVECQAESSGISMTSAPYKGKWSKNSASVSTSDLDRSISRSSLISANSRISNRCNWPSPFQYIVYQNSCC